MFVWAALVILLLNFDQPLALLVISVCVGGFMVFLHAMLLIVLTIATQAPQLFSTP
ncbi:MAG: hypothetical protein M3143_10230 [Actinomycetota bacterium]|nr:hypothetical protein [Actinomycetota bacterium]